jgi:hypothetical protein
MIDGVPARYGTTLFQGDVLQTKNASTAMVRLRSGASLVMSENSEMALELADPGAGTNGMNLHRGAIKLRNPSPQPEGVAVPGASVVVQGTEGFPAVCRIAAVEQSSTIINDRGHVEIRGSGAALTVPMGQYVTLEAGHPQGGSQAAGFVSAVIPVANVQRHDQPMQIQLDPQDVVYLQDAVQTLSTGRVRILLQDGSYLTIGAHTFMTIARCDAQTQQTKVELTRGLMRADVVKLTKHGASFEVQTETALISALGTVFLVDAHPNLTRVDCIEGLCSVQNINPAIAGQVTLHAGESTTVPRGLPPTAPAPSPPAEEQSRIGRTSMGPGAAKKAAAWHIGSLSESQSIALAVGIGAGVTVPVVVWGPSPSGSLASPSGP